MIPTAYIKVMLLFMVVINVIAFLNGCSERRYRPIIVEKPPVRVAVGGELDEEQIALFKWTVKEVMRGEYKDYKWEHPLGATVGMNITIDEKYVSETKATQ